jgi:hypothetical protein
MRQMDQRAKLGRGEPRAAGRAAEPSSYLLFDALRDRRSRRFGMGMKLGEPTPFESDRPPVPPTEEEQAMLAFAACGITGAALNDLSLGVAEGGGMMAGTFGRTVGSVDAVNTVSVFVTDDGATHLIRRPQELEPGEVRTLVELARAGDYVEAYRRARSRRAAVQRGDQPLGGERPGLNLVPARRRDRLGNHQRPAGAAQQAAAVLHPR